MRRSILIVMLDVMVLSVLALTAGKRGGNENNIPVPLYRWSTVVEEGLRKEQAYQDEVKRLEEQLARSAALAEQAMRQAEEARAAAGRERSGSQEMQQRVHEMELAAEKARSATELAKREMQLAQQTAEQARLRTEEYERQRSTAEQQAAQARIEAQRLQTVASSAESAQQQAEREAAEAAARIEALEEQVAQLDELKTAEAAAKERARSLEEERERLAAERGRLAEQNEQYAAKLAGLHGEVAALEVQKQDAVETAAQLEQEKQQAEVERQKSVWIRRDESLRRLNISYTEYNSRNSRDFVTRRELVMPLVKVGRGVLIPSDFRKLGLARSFFGGLSDSVSQVEGTLRTLSGDVNALPLSSILVPGPEPQVCLVRFEGEQDGALESITMETLKERRIKDALLFSPDEVNEHGRVEIVPVIGSDYLTVEHASGKKPKVGDYLLTDRGEFIGLMVTKEQCYVMPHVLSRTPLPVIIPITSSNQNSVYFEEFITNLNRARDRMDDHLKQREF